MRLKRERGVDYHSSIAIIATPTVRVARRGDAFLPYRVRNDLVLLPNPAYGSAALSTNRKMGLADKSSIDETRDETRFEIKKKKKRRGGGWVLLPSAFSSRL